MQAIRGVQHGWQRTDADINSVHDHPVMTVTSAQRTYRDSILMRTLEFTRRSEYQLLGTDAHMQGGGDALQRCVKFATRPKFASSAALRTLLRRDRVNMHGSCSKTVRQASTHTAVHGLPAAMQALGGNCKPQLILLIAAHRDASSITLSMRSIVHVSISIPSAN